MNNSASSSPFISLIDSALIALAIEATTSKPSGTHLTSAVVHRFRSMPHRDRCILASGLTVLSVILQNEVKFQPRIFDRHVKIRVSGQSQAQQLQEHLFAWGCGFHNGSYPLQKTVELGHLPLHSIHVSPTGCIGLNFDPNWFDQSQDHELSLPTVLSASTPEFLIQPADACSSEA